MSDETASALMLAAVAGATWLAVRLISIRALPRASRAVEEWRERKASWLPVPMPAATPPEPALRAPDPREQTLRWIPMGKLPKQALCAFFVNDRRAYLILTDGSIWEVNRSENDEISVERKG